MEVETLVAQLEGRDQNAAYACFLQLREESRRSPAVYPFFDRFAAMLESGSSYVRTRGLLLIAANARWDTDNRIDEIIGPFLTHVMDARPTVSRQLIAALPELACQKPDLAPDICRALESADPGRYRDSMAPLVTQDISLALRQIYGY